MGRHTLRGTLDSGEVRRLIVDDGILTQGHKVVSFEIFPSDVNSGSNDVAGVLAIDYDGAQQTWLAEDNRQIGWSSTTMSTSNSVNNKTDIIDPDHIVLRDLYVTAYSNSGRINFLVVLDPVSISEDEAVLQLIKERSQDDLR